MTVFLGFNSDALPAWTITDPEKETKEWLDENNFFLDGEAWNALPPVIDSFELRNEIRKLGHLNEKYVARALEEGIGYGYFRSKEEYEEMKALGEKIIDDVCRARDEKDPSITLIDRLSGDIGRRLETTESARKANGETSLIDPGKFLEAF